MKPSENPGHYIKSHKQEVIEKVFDITHYGELPMKTPPLLSATKLKLANYLVTDNAGVIKKLKKEDI